MLDLVGVAAVRAARTTDVSPTLRLADPAFVPFPGGLRFGQSGRNDNAEHGKSKESMPAGHSPNVPEGAGPLQRSAPRVPSAVQKTEVQKTGMTTILLLVGSNLS